MAAFQPKGSRAIRVIVTELAAATAYGELLTFERIAQAIGVDSNDRVQVRQAVSAARPLLLRDHNCALVAKRGEGYRVARPGEFAGIAQEHRRKSDRSLGRALSTIEHAPVSDMDADERKRWEATGTVIRNLHNRMSSAEQRLADIEAVLFGPPRKTIQGEIEKDRA